MIKQYGRHSPVLAEAESEEKTTYELLTAFLKKKKKKVDLVSNKIQQLNQHTTKNISFIQNPNTANLILEVHTLTLETPDIHYKTTHYRITGS